MRVMLAASIIYFTLALLSGYLTLHGQRKIKQGHASESYRQALDEGGKTVQVFAVILFTIIPVGGFFYVGAFIFQAFRWAGSMVRGRQ